MKSENFLDEATKPTLDSACTDKQYKNAGTFLMQLHSQKTVVEPGSHFSFTHLTFWRSFGTSAGERRSVGQMLLLYSIITKVLLIVDTTSWLIVSTKFNGNDSNNHIHDAIKNAHCSRKNWN